MVMKKYVFISLFLMLLIFQEGYAQQMEDFKINGRIQYDFEFLKRQKMDKWQVGNEFRRVHFSMGGKFSKVFKFKVEINFAHAKIGFRDAYIEYVNKKIGNFAIGSKAEPTGLDIGTSSKYIPFMERAMLTALQDFRWGTGLHYAHHHLLDNRMGFQMALTNKGVNGEGFVDKHVEKGMNFVTRIYGLPYFNKEKKHLVHLGINYATRPYKDLKFRPENHMGEKYHYVVPGGVRRLQTGMETALIVGPFSLQGEYKTSQIAASLPGDFKVTGYYGLASFFLTGESRVYKHGGFGRVKPAKDITHGGAGAWEILVRYSVMDFSEDLVKLPDNAGLPKKVENTALGINWYLTSHLRIMYNFILTRDSHPQGNLTAHMIRFQMDF